MAAKNAIVKGAFELWSLHVCEKRSKAWTTEIFLNICVHATRYKRVQSLDRLNWESNSPEAENKEQKSHAKTKTRHFPILLRINVASILSNIEVVNVRVSRKYINQPLAKSSLILCNKILQKKWQLQKVFTKSWLLGHRGV